MITRVVAMENAPGSANHIDILRRSDWGARTNLPRLGLLVDRTRRTEVFIHHTAVVDGDSTPNEWATLDAVNFQMRKLQTIRAEDLGPDVPYSMVAFCMSNGDLILCEGRGLHRSGAHTCRHNSSALGISFYGNFEALPLPTHFDAQLTALGNWLRDLRVNNGFVKLGTQRPYGREVFAHRDVMATTCPGDHMFTKLHLIRFL